MKKKVKNVCDYSYFYKTKQKIKSKFNLNKLFFTIKPNFTIAHIVNTNSITQRWITVAFFT